jgi:hypothetical protein
MASAVAGGASFFGAAVRFGAAAARDNDRTTTTTVPLQRLIEPPVGCDGAEGSVTQVTAAIEFAFTTARSQRFSLID